MAQNVYFDLPRVHQAALQAQAMQGDMEERKLRRQELEQQRAQAERTKNIYAKAAEGAIDPVTGQIDEMKLNRNLERSMLSSGDVPGYMSLREKSRPNADMMKQIISNRGQIANGLASIAQEAGFENAQRVYREFVRPAAIAQERQMGYQPRPEEWPDINSPEQLMAIAAQHKQAGGQIYDFLPTSSGYAVGDKTTGTIRPGRLEGSQERPIPISADIGLAGAKAGAIKGSAERAETQAKREAAFPKVQLANEEFNDQSDLVMQYIDTAINQAQGLVSSGFGSTYLSKIGSSSAKDLAETLNTVRANVGFDKLQAMRQASPTGGALGQVSDNENKLLQSVLGSVAQDQSASQLVANLKRIKGRMTRSRENINSAFKREYGSFMGAPAAPARTAAPGGASIAPAGVKAKLPDGRIVTSDGKGGWR